MFGELAQIYILGQVIEDMKWPYVNNFLDHRSLQLYSVIS